MSSATVDPTTPRRESAPAGERGSEPSRELWLLLAGVLLFVAMTVWWLTQDDRVQDWDNGLHTLLAFGIHDQLAAGNLTGWFTEFNTYPPLVHVIGALGCSSAARAQCR